MGMAEDYARNVMAKVPMILSAMHAHPQHDWIMWMDDDTWFNPGARCCRPLPTTVLCWRAPQASFCHYLRIFFREIHCLFY